MTSHGSRCARRTLPACRSVASSTSLGEGRGSSSKRRRPVLYQPGIGPSGRVRDRLVRPVSRHGSERAEGVRRCGRAPETAEQPGDDDILFRLGQLAERRSRFAALQQHRVEVLIGFEQAHGRVTIPEAQRLDLVLAFHVRHPELEDRAGSVAAHGGRDPRAAHLVAVEWGSQRQRPPVLQLADGVGSCSSQARRSGVPRHVAASRSGMISVTYHVLLSMVRTMVGGDFADIFCDWLYLGCIISDLHVPLLWSDHLI